MPVEVIDLTDTESVTNNGIVNNNNRKKKRIKSKAEHSCISDEKAEEVVKAKTKRKKLKRTHGETVKSKHKKGKNKSKTQKMGESEMAAHVIDSTHIGESVVSEEVVTSNDKKIRIKKSKTQHSFLPDTDDEHELDKVGDTSRGNVGNSGTENRLKISAMNKAKATDTCSLDSSEEMEEEEASDGDIFESIFNDHESYDSDATTIVTSNFADMHSTAMKVRLNKSLTRGWMVELDEEERQKLENLDIVIDWDVSPMHKVSTLMPLKSNERKKLKQEGMERLTGVWSRQETVILAKNWERFKREYDITDPLALIGARKEVKLKKNETAKFAKYLGRGLDRRSLVSIYQQARRLLHPFKYKGRLKKHEVKRMRQLLLIHGHKWEKIGLEMDRCGSDLYYHWRFNTKRILPMIQICTDNGRWSSKEDDRLVTALTTVTGIEDLTNIPHDVPWPEVAKLVKTRNFHQCRKHWICNLSYEIRGKIKCKWSTANDIKLLKMLWDGPWQLECDIPWEDICEEFDSVNHYHLAEKWRKLRQIVPQHYIKTYTDIIDWLIHDHLPKLEETNETSEIDTDTDT